MKRLLAVLLAASLTTACVAPVLIVGGAALGAAWVGSDPRAPEVVKADYELRTRFDQQIVDTFKSRAHVNVNVFNGHVLLSGEVPDAAAKAQLDQMAAALASARILNETTVAATSSLTDRANDGQIAARVRAQILADSRNTAATHILVVAERGVVYLMGITPAAIAERAAASASRVAGVKQVVKLMEISG